MICTDSSQGVLTSRWKKNKRGKRILEQMMMTEAGAWNFKLRPAGLSRCVWRRGGGAEDENLQAMKQQQKQAELTSKMLAAAASWSGGDGRQGGVCSGAGFVWTEHGSAVRGNW
jgi:hypothetical protein